MNSRAYDNAHHVDRIFIFDLSRQKLSLSFSRIQLIKKIDIAIFTTLKHNNGNYEYRICKDNLLIVLIKQF